MTDGQHDTLVLLTRSYPYSAMAESFLDAEIPALSARFAAVVIVPRVLPPAIERTERIFPPNVTVDTSLLALSPPGRSSLSRLQCVARALGSPHLYREVLRAPGLSGKVRVLQKRLLVPLCVALKTRTWALRQIREGRIDPSRTLFYTYWLDGSAFGMALAKRDSPGLRLVSRAHGADLYHDRHTPPSIPFQAETLPSLDRLFLISEHGRRYITGRSPAVADRCRVARLGVADPGFLAVPSSDGTFRVVSVSYTVAVKRLDLLIAGLAELGKRRPDARIVWAHIGYGPLEEQIEALAKERLPANVTARFTGFLPGVYPYYREHPVDALVNVSASEGIPVSIMEAQSCGIPVIATAVGGTPEIVSGRVGVLLPENPSPAAIADAVGRIMDHPAEAVEMRAASRRNWEAGYSAEANFRTFVRELRQV